MAGSLDSSGAPGATSSYILEDIYSRLNLGTAGTPGTFTEPTAGPTAGTMHTLNDIMGVVPVVDNANGASAGDVLAGKTFWGLTSGGWGPRTGTLATRTVSNATVSQAAGYYSAFNLSTVDTNLATANIKSGVSIFGVSGTSTVVDTVSGTAVAGDLLLGKTAYVAGATVTGTIATRTLSAANDTVAAGNYAATTLSAVDTDLATGNIKSGVNIFGVTGKPEVVDTTSGTAVAGDLLLGKTAYVAGATVTGTIATRTLSAANDTVAAGNYAATTLSAVDTDLAISNIKYGASIFGVTGNLSGGVSCTCPGGSSPLGRWCDNNNGTVTDTTTGLVWLKDASWGGQKKWVDSSTWDDAQTRAGTLSNVTAGAGLNDGSVAGDWRLPTKTELVKLTTGTEPISSVSLQKFTDVQSVTYWSSTTVAGNTASAWSVTLGPGGVLDYVKTDSYFVWPVRGGQ